MLRFFIPAGYPATGIHPGDVRLKVDDYMLYEMSDVSHSFHFLRGELFVIFQIVEDVFSAFMSL